MDPLDLGCIPRQKSHLVSRVAKGSYRMGSDESGTTRHQHTHGAEGGGSERPAPEGVTTSLGYAPGVGDVLIPVFLLAGGEIFLGMLALRVLWWMLRGWREALVKDSPPPEPDGGGRPVLVLVNGERRPRSEDRALRPAA